MILNLLILLLLFLIIDAWRSGTHRTGRRSLGTSVRRFFQYGLSFAALVLVAIGISGLLTRALQRGVLIGDAGAALARSLSFTIVGIPLLVLLLLWTRRTTQSDPEEHRSLAAYIAASLSELVPLGIFIVNVQVVFRGLLSIDPYDAGALAQTLVWGAVWYLYRRAHEGIDLRDYVGATFGLWLIGSGLASIIAATLRGLTIGAASELAAANDRPIPAAAVTLFVGGFVWLVYWIGSGQGARHSNYWRAYVLLAGVAGGLIAAVIAATTALYDGLVWWVGSPSASDAAAHFHATPMEGGVVIAGALVWWYHRGILIEAGRDLRDETRRVYEYLVAAIGLIAAAVGLTILIVAGIESATASAQIAGSGAANTLLLALTLLVVGAPVWWIYWSMIRRAMRVDPMAEVVSMTRRIYLLLLFGVVGVAAVIALLVAVYFFFEDIVTGQFAFETLRRMRWGLGILLSAGLIAGYHWRIFAAEREQMPAEVHHRVVIVGPLVHGLREALEDKFHARVDYWTTPGEGPTPDIAAVLDAIAAVPSRDVAVVLAGAEVRAEAAQRD